MKTTGCSVCPIVDPSAAMERCALVLWKYRFAFYFFRDSVELWRPQVRQIQESCLQELMRVIHHQVHQHLETAADRRFSGGSQPPPEAETSVLHRDSSKSAESPRVPPRQS